jgi:hypothetical protein
MSAAKTYRERGGGFNRSPRRTFNGYDREPDEVDWNAVGMDPNRIGTIDHAADDRASGKLSFTGQHVPVGNPSSIALVDLAQS